MPQPYPDPYSGLARGLQSGMQLGANLSNIRKNEQIREAEAQYRQKLLDLNTSKAVRQQKQQEFQNTLVKMDANSNMMLNRNLSKETRFGAWEAYRVEHNKLGPNQPLPKLTSEQYFAQENAVKKGIKQVSGLYQEAQKDPRAMQTLIQEYPKIISEALGAGAQPSTFAPLTKAIGGLQQQTQRGLQADALIGLAGKPQVGPPTAQQQALGGYVRAGGSPGAIKGLLPQPTKGITVAPGAGVIDPITGRSIYQQPTRFSPTIQAEKLRQQRKKGGTALSKEERIRQRLIKLSPEQRISYFRRTEKLDREGAEKLNNLFEIENNLEGQKGRVAAETLLQQAQPTAEQIRADFKAGKLNREEARQRLQAIGFK